MTRIIQARSREEIIVDDDVYEFLKDKDVVIDAKGYARRHIGTFPTIDQAAKAYNNELITNGGDLRKLNEVSQ